MTADVPVGWESVTIPELVGEGGVFSDGDWVESKDQDPYGDVRLIQLADIGDGRWINRSNRYLRREVAERLGCTFLAEGDVLVARMPDPLGRACIFPGDSLPSVTAVDVCIIRSPDRRFSHRWLMWFINAPQFRRRVLELQKGTTRKRISRKNLGTIPLNVPPRAAQDRIAERIDELVSDLDAGVATLERATANLARYRAAVLKAAVEGRLVPTEANLAYRGAHAYKPAIELVRENASPPRPPRYQSRSRDVIRGHAALAVGNPGDDLPEGWTWVALADVARLETGHTPSRRHPEWWGGDVPWIGIKDARTHHGGVIYSTLQHTNAEGLANSAARLLPAGTVCLSRTASVGYVVVMGVPMATSQDFVNWVCTPPVDPHWLRCVLLADRRALFRFGKGTTHTTIYFPEVMSLHIALPPLAEQRRIVAEVDRLLSVADHANQAVTNARIQVQSLRRGVLRAAFRGELSPDGSVDSVAGV